MAGILGLAPDDYRVIGLALAEYAAGTPRGTRDEDDRDQADHLHTQLVQWGFIPAATSE